MSDFDCQSCGACCDVGTWMAVNLTDKDIERIGHPLRNLVVRMPSVFEIVALNHPPTMRARGDRCVCLRGTVGESVQCDIYSKRPESCQSFEAGEFWCRQIREACNIGVS